MLQCHISTKVSNISTIITKFEITIKKLLVILEISLKDAVELQKIIFLKVG